MKPNQGWQLDDSKETISGGVRALWCKMVHQKRPPVQFHLQIHSAVPTETVAELEGSTPTPNPQTHMAFRPADRLATDSGADPEHQQHESTRSTTNNRLLG